MVHKVLKLLTREISGIHEAAYLLAIFAFLSQLLGLIRDRLLAHHFGAESGLDLYYAAFKIPDFIFISVGSLVSVSVLVPFLIERMNKEKEEGEAFVNQIFSFFLIFITISCAIIFFFIPEITGLIFPGITAPGDRAQLILLTRILLVSPFFLGLSNFFASITQAHRKFITFAISPLFYNIGIIVGILFLAPRFGIIGVTYGVILGAFCHFLLQFASISKDKMLPKFVFQIRFNEIKKIILLSFPRTLTLSSSSFALIFLLAFASLMGEGAISIFNLAFNLQSVPLSIIGVSYSMAAFPTLSMLYGKGDMETFIKQIILAARHIIFWSLPVAVLFIVLRAQIVRTILGSGKFDWSDTRLTAAALALFAFSVAAQSLSLLFIRGYYSASKTKKPLFINLISSGLIVLFAYFAIQFYTLNVTFQYFFDSLFKVEGLAGGIILMLPLGFALGSIANVLCLWFFFERDFARISRPLIKTLFHSLGSSLIMGTVSYFFLNFFDDFLDINTLLGIFLQGFFSGILGIIAGIFVLKLLKNEELEDISKTFHKKIWKSEIISPPTSPQV